MTKEEIQQRLTGLDDAALTAALLEYGALIAACAIDDLPIEQEPVMQMVTHAPDANHPDSYMVRIVPFSRTNPASHIYLRKFSADVICFADDPEET